MNRFSDNAVRRTVFISDLHLSDDTPDLNALFACCLEQWRGKIDALYILGDLFDAWVGDDAADGAAREAAGCLKNFAVETPVYFICGNRDFLLGERFARASGIQLLPAQQLIDLYGKQMILLHGDEMCTADKKYLRYRRIIRHPWVCGVLSALPLKTRLRIAVKLREASRRSKARNGLSEISDVTGQGVSEVLARFPDADGMIHGHTHRRNCHIHSAGEKTVRRWVLPDWKHGQGGCLNVFADGRYEWETLK
ncbi:MAG: UDP-2,3-diacylglucosamine diphosphatase [Neisseria sp.]|nr:UDP-2,3-diacylglucosamine diphosphatase [Neisseria sp.]